MLSNLIRNVLSGTISGVINGSGGAPPINQRYFTQLDGQSKYWRRIEPDYGQATEATLECLFYGSGDSGFELLVGRASGNSNRFYLGLQNSQVIFGSGSASGSSPTTIDNSKINHAKLVADGSSVKFYVNDVLITQVAQDWTGALDEVGFGSIGGTASFYDGILVAARVTTDTVDNIYGLDTNLPYDLPDGVTLGQELWAGALSASDPSITDNGNGTYFCDGSQSGNAVFRINSALDANTAYYSGLSVSNYTDVGGGASKRVRMSVGTTLINATADGSYSGQTETQSDINIYCTVEVGVSCTISAISVKEIPDPALIFENGSIDQSDRLLVTENAEVGFLGEDKWFDAIKAVTGQATVPTDDSITIDEVGGTLAGVAIDAPAAPITVTGDCDLISGQVDISVVPALAGVAASITGSGPFSFDLDSQGALGFKRAFSGGAQAVITNIKVKLRYDYADGASPDAGTYSSEYSNEYS